MTFINTGADLQSAWQTSHDTVSYLVAPLSCSDSERLKADIEFIMAGFPTLPHQEWFKCFLTLSSMDYEGFLFRDECDFGFKLTAILVVVSGSKIHRNVNLT